MKVQLVFKWVQKNPIYIKNRAVNLRTFDQFNRTKSKFAYKTWSATNAQEPAISAANKN